jgi:predicted DNA binding CopG/RHH family protein
LRDLRATSNKAINLYCYIPINLGVDLVQINIRPRRNGNQAMVESLSIRLCADEKEALRLEASKRGVPMTQFIRETMRTAVAA